jgi:hypothetical protein
MGDGCPIVGVGHTMLECTQLAYFALENIMIKAQTFEQLIEKNPEL